MTEMRLTGFAPGTDLGMFSATVGGETDSTTVNSFQLPSKVSGLPRISGGQFQTDTVALDETGLTGITARQWSIVGGATLGTGGTQSLAGLMGQVHCTITCDQGTKVTPPIFVYMSMGMASHDADDVSALAICPHTEATHVASASGNWNDTATWLDGRIPRKGARALIPHGIAVGYDNPVAGVRLDWLRVDGTLVWSQSVSTQTLVEHFIITRSGKVECGTPASRIPSNITHEIVVSNRDCRAENRFPTDMNITRDPGLIGRGIVSQGSRVMWGAFKTSWLRTANDAAPLAGATSATLSYAPTGWNVGDLIIIGGTGNTAIRETEERIVTALNGAVVSWADPLVYDHDHHNPLVTRSDLQPGIANLTRNVKIRSENGSAPAYQRGHTMDMHMRCHADIWDVEHIDLGRTIKRMDTPAGKIQANGNFRYWNQVVDSDEGAVWVEEPPTAHSNIQSRYAMHAHFVGFLKPQVDTYQNCSIRNVPGWGIAHHGSEVHANQCAIYDYEGAGIAAETGDEIGEWQENFTAGGKTKTFRTPKNRGGRRGLNGDFFFDGYGLAMRSRAIRCNSNLAMDNSWGIVFYHRSDPGSLTPFISHVAANLDLKDLMGFRNNGTMAPARYPIVHANDNESAGVYGGGLFVTKPSGQQEHGLNVNIKRFKSWGFFQDGILIEYINQYALTDIDVVAPATGGALRGVYVSANNAQVAVVRPKTERCARGVIFSGIDAIVEDAGFNNTTNPKFMLVAHTSLNDVTSVDHEINPSTGQTSAGVTRTWLSEPPYIQPSHDLPFKLAEWDRGTAPVTGLTLVQTGTLTDTAGAGGVLPKPGDNTGMPLDGVEADWFDARTYVQVNGYYTVSSVPYIIFPLYFSDRLTGNWIKSYHGIELTGSLAGYVNNGPYSISAAAPVVGTATLNTTQDTSETIDILALTTDADGDTASLSASYFAPDHGRIEVLGGSITYTPDAGYTGPDKAQFAVEDGKGRATRVDLNITVS